jgi:hypothetical protein
MAGRNSRRVKEHEDWMESMIKALCLHTKNKIIKSIQIGKIGGKEEVK